MLGLVEGVFSKRRKFYRVINNGSEIDHLNKRKIQKRISKNRRPFDTGSVKHLSALNVRLALRSFCVDLLQKCYCRLMAGCKDAVSLKFFA